MMQLVGMVVPVEENDAFTQVYYEKFFMESVELVLYKKTCRTATDPPLSIYLIG